MALTRLKVLWSSVTSQVRGRYFPLVALAGLYLALATVTRLILYATHVHELEQPLGGAPRVFGYGLLYDLATGFYLFFPYAAYLFALPERLHRSRVHRLMLVGTSFLAVFGLLYLAPVEYFFFDEFDARFNFVAVSYLLYPHEVFVNIWESYPVGRVLTVVFLLAVGLQWWLRHSWRASFERPSRLRERAPVFALCAVGMLTGHQALDVNTARQSDSRIANELAQNGIYAFVYALRNNDLDYRQYYVTVSEDEAVARARRLVAQPNSHWLEGSANPIARHVDNPGPTKRLNVVVLVEESLGAEFLGTYGDTRGLTPNLDRLARDSLVFRRAYATGTRTVRGLEAITASFPPIPGESIIKRRSAGPVFTWGDVMRAKGYRTLFFYGGYGSFDGMNDFYRHNGFEVQDRSDIADAAFANIWGVSDEDLFRHALGVLDERHTRGERFFAVVLTTSNHKPFTFPDGIAGVRAEGGGRRDGVRYADYAIGRFFAMVKNKAYFDDTLFVVVGDHGARVYGHEDIPMRSYELPLLVYAPKHVAPRQVDTLVSQIDIAPTVLGLLGISYDSVFFGRDAFATADRERFVLLSHNRDVGLFRHDTLVVLGMPRTASTLHYDRAANAQQPVAADAEQARDAAGLFQLGYELFQRGRYALAPRPEALASSRAL